MKKTFIGILIGIVICGAGYMITHKDKPSTATTTTIEQSEDSVKALKEAQEEAMKNAKEQEKHIDDDVRKVILNGEEYKVGMMKGLREEDYDYNKMASFRLSSMDDPLIDILYNPNTNYDPIWYFGDNGVSAVVFLYKDEPTILRYENGTLKCGMGKKEVKDKEKLDSLAMSLFGESAYWDYVLNAAKNQVQIQQQFIDQEQQQMDAEFDRQMQDIYDEYDKQYEKTMNDIQYGIFN